MLLCLNDHPYQCFRVTGEGKHIVDGKNIPRLFDVNTKHEMNMRQKQLTTGIYKPTFLLGASQPGHVVNQVCVM